jgi:hypothetical protein
MRLHDHAVAERNLPVTGDRSLAFVPNGKYRRCVKIAHQRPPSIS